MSLIENAVNPVVIPMLAFIMDDDRIKITRGRIDAEFMLRITIRSL
jgi:hypothetical protein